MKEKKKNRGEKGEKKGKEEHPAPMGVVQWEATHASEFLQLQHPISWVCVSTAADVVVVLSLQLSYSIFFLSVFYDDGFEMERISRIECSAFRHQRTLKVAPFDRKKGTRAGPSAYIFSISIVFSLKESTTYAETITHKQDRRYKKAFNDLSNAFLQRRRRLSGRARAQVVVRRSPADKETAAKDVRYLVNAHSTRQDISPL